MFIITNRTSDGEYTPSVTHTRKSAKKWMKECTAENIRAYKSDEYPELEDMTDDEVIKWAKNNIGRFVFRDDYSYIEYIGGTYNEMNIYKSRGLFL